MNSARTARYRRPLAAHVFRLSAIAERRKSPLAAGVLFLLEIAESRTDPRPYVRRAVAMLRGTR